MNTRLLLLATLLVADLSLATLPPETLPLAIQQQVAAQQALARQESEANATLRKWYESALDAVKKDATGRGDLNSVLGADQERDRLDRDLTPEEKSKLTPVMRKVRDQYDQARVQMANQQKAKLAALLRAYLTTLEVLEKKYTQNSDIEKAVASRDERTKAEEQLKVLTPTAVLAGTASVAATPLAANPPQRPVQANDSDGSGKIKEAPGGAPSKAIEPIKDLRKQLAGTTWNAVPGTSLRGGLAASLTFTEKEVQPGGYRYEVDRHNIVTITFNGGDKQPMTLTKGGTRLQFWQGKTERAYELVPK
jgi:hypothetical protein